MLARPVRRSPLVPPLVGVLGTGLPWESGGGGAALSAPVITVAPVVSGTRGGTLSCTTGTWTGSPAPTYTYQWYVAATAGGGGSFSTIGGATAATLDDASYLAYDVKCAVTATNAVTAVAADSNTLGAYSLTSLQAEPGAAFGLMATAGVTGDPITQWDDQWTSGAVFTSGTAPDYDATGLDGKPCVVLNGTSTVLNSGALTLAAGDKTIYVVQDLTDVTAAVRILFAFHTNAGPVGRLYIYQHQGGGLVSIFDGTSALTFSAAAATTGPQVMCYVMDSAGAAGSSAAYRDGVSLGTATCGTINASDDCTLGRSPGAAIQYGKAKIGACFVFDALHDATVRARVNTFLGAYFLTP